MWIDPETGAILKTDADYDFDPADRYHRSRARIVTEYRRDTKLGILVPDRMEETYKSPPSMTPMRGVVTDAHARSEDPQEDNYVSTLEATTQYSAYVRFGVSTGAVLV